MFTIKLEKAALQKQLEVNLGLDKGKLKGKSVQKIVNYINAIDSKFTVFKICIDE